MREKLINLISNSIIFKYKLPTEEIKKSKVSTQEDYCYTNNEPQNISKIIYNGIIEFAKNEYDIDYNDLELEQKKALKTLIRYNENASFQAKKKYGFFGEVLLFSILKTFFYTDVFISKGYFFSVLDKGEAKGYDVYNLIQNNDNIELWFGESKFYINYKSAINSVIDKLSNAISDDYFDSNLMAIITKKEKITTMPKTISKIIESWETNPDIKLSEEIRKYNIKLVYPIFIAFEIDNNEYSQIIKDCIFYIKDKSLKAGLQLNVTFDFSIFFIFLPLKNVNKIKGDVIKWITDKEQLI